MKYVRIILFASIVLANLYPAHAQKLKDYYVSYPQESGTLYHIFPISLYQHKPDGDLIVDITCQCGVDSATINFTYYAGRMESLDSVKFYAGPVAMCGRTERLFVEPETLKRWAHRYTLKVPQRQLFSFFSPNREGGADLYVGGKAKTYALKNSEWNKKAPILRRILEMVRSECGE